MVRTTDEFIGDVFTIGIIVVGGGICLTGILGSYGYKYIRKNISPKYALMCNKKNL